MNSTAKKILIIIFASILLEALIGFAAFRIFSNSMFSGTGANETGTDETVDYTPLNEDTLIILFSHAGDDAEGNHVENRVIIQGAIKPGDIPVYTDKEQIVFVSCANSTLLGQGKTALAGMGYSNIMEM